MFSILRSNLGRRIVLLVSMSMLLMIVTLMISGWLAVTESTERVTHEREALAQATASHLDYILRQNLARLDAVQYAPGLDLEDTSLDAEQRALHSAYLGSIFDDGLFITDQKGTVLLSEPQGSTLSNFNISGYAPVAQTLSTAKPSVSNVIALPSGRSIILAVTPLRNNSGRIVGLVGGQIDPTRLTLRESTLSVSLGEGSHIDVIDSRGVVLASSDLQRILKIDTQGGPGDDVAQIAQLSSAPWLIAVMQPRQEALAPVRAMEQRFIVFGLLGLIVVFLFTWGMARSLLRPIAQLKSAAQDIARGDLSKPVPYSGNDEIGELGRAFDTMRLGLRKSLDEVNEINRGLEAKVDERTRKLEESYREIERKEVARGELLRRVLSVQEDERKRIARELHDETTQSILALVMSLEAAARAEELPIQARERLTKIRNLGTSTLDSVHRIIFDLRPSVLDDLGLLSAIRWLAEKRLGTTPAKTRVEVTGEERKLPPTVEIALFRVVQEAITNIARHAEAQNVVISVEYRESSILIEVEDDGKGFDLASISPADEARGKGLGLMGMHERVSLIGGKFRIESHPGHGTHLTVEVPLGGEVTA